MGKFDMGKHKWDKIFQDRVVPTLPVELTKAWWDKHKGVLAKLAISTGIGEALTKVQAMFAGVNWTDPAKDYAPGRPDQEEANLDRCKAFITSGPIKNFHKALKDAAAIAKDAAAKMKKNALCPKSATAAAEEVFDNADKLMVCVNPNSLGECLKTAVDAYMKAVGEKFRKAAKDIVTKAKPVIGKAPGIIGKLKAGVAKFPDTGCGMENYKTISGDAFTLARDMTQPIGNMLKSIKAGAALENADAAALKSLYDQLVVYSNAQSGNKFFEGKTTKQECTAVVLDIERLSNRYAALVNPITVQD